MEGCLLKWTNYWSGWQMRWFVLQDGILSYFLSSDTVNQGCKGSMKVSAIEIHVSSVDNTRMDLSIPGEKNIYLKAASSQERQLWLVALGSSKACVTNNNRKDSFIEPSSPDELKAKKSELRLYCDMLMQQVHMVKTSVTSSPDIDVEKLTEGSTLLGVTCDTFIQTLEECMKLSNIVQSKQEVAQIMEQGINNMSKPTIPIMKMNSGDKKT